MTGTRTSVHLLLRQAMRALEAHQRERLAGIALTPLQVAVLQALKGQRGLAQNEVARRTGTDRSSMAELARRLEARGLIVRKPHRKDGRALALYLSPKGRRLLLKARPLLEEAELALLATLSDKERAALLRALARLGQR